MMFSSPLPSTFAVICLFSTSHAHTWLENLRLIGSNGSFVGDLGYPRSIVDRSAPGFTDEDLIHRLGPDQVSNPSTPICRLSQVFGRQPSNFPALKAAPGDNVAMRFSENGHVTLLTQSRPAGSGLVFVYGTKTPSNDDKFTSIHRIWNTAGTGGDGQGKLIATRFYDDGQCYQRNGEAISQQRQKTFPNPAADGTDFLCQTDIQIPLDAGISGDYSLYWVWEWPLFADAGLVPETYTACADIKLTDKTNSAVGEFVAKQGFNQGGIEVQLENQFMFDPSVEPDRTTPPPFHTVPIRSSLTLVVPVVSTASIQSTLALLPSTTLIKAFSSVPSKASTTAVPELTPPIAQSFTTVRATMSPLTETNFIDITPEKTNIVEGTLRGTPTLTPLPVDAFIGSRKILPHL